MNTVVKYFTATMVTLYAILSFHAFWVNFTNGWWHKFTEILPWSIAVLVVSITYFYLLFNAKEDFRVHYIAIGFIFFTFICRFIWISYFDAQQVSDFREYWRVGQLIAVNGFSEDTFSQAYELVNVTHFLDTYITRSVFYTLPIQYLFGNSQKALELVNISLVTLAMILYYEYGKKLLTVKIAAGSLLFFFWNPDIWYGVTLASPDIAFLPFFMGLCLIVNYLGNNLYKSDILRIPFILLSLAIGIFIFIIDIQRGFGSPIWFALVLMIGYFILSDHNKSFITSEGGLRHFLKKKGIQRSIIIYLILFLLLPFGAYQLSKTTLFSFINLNSGTNYITYFASKDVLGASSYGEMRPWRQDYSVQLPEEIKRSYSLNKLFHEIFSDPLETTNYLFRKNEVLANPTGTLWFSSQPAEDPWVGQTNTENIAMQRSLMILITALLFLLIFIRLLFYKCFTVPRNMYFLIFFTAFFYLFILMFLESQPRYNVFSVFLISLLASQLIFSLEKWMFRKTIKKTVDFVQR